MFNEMDDMILPEGFDPEAGDANFDENGELVEVVTAPTTESTTTTQPDAEVTPTAEPEVQEPTTALEQTQPEVVPEAPKFKVKFNHEERELSFDEAQIYAQKGMNFDKVEQRAKEHEAKLGEYEEMAKLFGYENASDMMTQAKKNFIDRKVQDLVDQGNSEAMARFLVNQEYGQQKQAVQEQPRQLSSGLPQDVKEQLDEFNAAYPGVTKIPDEVFQMHRDGVRLKTAYAIYQNNNARQEALEKANAEAQAAKNDLAILKQNQAAAARGPVSGTVGSDVPPASDEENDPFLKGFFADRF